MKVLNVRNVNEALVKGIELINEQGWPTESRNGLTLEVPFPVSTVYQRPWERVLTCKVRDANPFFHIMESMWILAGRNDVKFLAEFNKRMQEYSDDGEYFNAPYGYRLRSHFKDTDGFHKVDQIESVIRTLKIDPNSRQAVCQIWDTGDLNRKTKDKACNMQCIFKIRRGKRLDLTVYNRSNDMLWGTYGANAVQFSILLEYVAAHLKVHQGTYTQVSNSYHVYVDGPGGQLRNKLNSASNANMPHNYDLYDHISMSDSNMDDFEHDLSLMFQVYDEFGLDEIGEMECWKSDYFNSLIIPMICVYLTYKKFGSNEASKHLDRIEDGSWALACTNWLSNRIK